MNTEGIDALNETSLKLPAVAMIATGNSIARAESPGKATNYHLVQLGIAAPKEWQKPRTKSPEPKRCSTSTETDAQTSANTSAKQHDSVADDLRVASDTPEVLLVVLNPEHRD